MKRLLLFTFIALTGAQLPAQVASLKYGDFDHWLSREVKESAILGGATKTLYEVTNATTWKQNKPYVNQGGSPWATSNVLAKVVGIVKTNTSVYPEKRGNGYCAKLYSHVEGVKVMGMVNIHVLAAGSLFLGEMREPITSSSNPQAKMSYGVPFKKKPKAVQFDYKVQLSDKPNRVRQNGFSKVRTVNGKDMPDVYLLLQKRWEDEDGNIYAKRIATMSHRFNHNTDWVNGAKFQLMYGDITSNPGYDAKVMALFTKESEAVKYAYNSKGKLMPIIEVEWGSADDEPTHMILAFNSSFGGAYVGSEGTTLWVDNVKLVY
ncbi:MAG: PCMD domain-containing protein [Bacteroidaceae bacterium]|nr:PCMD domain-containing protein [Bacteroidaceae bacterium]